MITIRGLLNRIRWDDAYGRARFALGYYDRVARSIIVVPLGEVHFDEHEPDAIVLNDAAGQPLAIPLHRVCQVFRNGELIWHRQVPSCAGPQ